jgi:hypothetical protein
MNVPNVEQRVYTEGEFTFLFTLGNFLGNYRGSRNFGLLFITVTIGYYVNDTNTKVQNAKVPNLKVPNFDDKSRCRIRTCRMVKMSML